MLKLLRKIPGFSELDDLTLSVVQEVLQPVNFNRGEQICVEGETGHQMFLIESGTVAVLKAVADEDPVKVATLKSGDIAGEMGLFGQKIRTATLQAHSQCMIWTLDYIVFETLLEEHGALAKGVLSYMSEHLARETSIVAKLIAKDAEKGLKVAFFQATPFRNELYQKNNQYNYSLHFFTPRLDLDTVPLAAGFHVIVVSANDCLNDEVIEQLSELGVEMIALRCAGFNNVNLAACERCGISVARVPAYSPYAIAEHAAALIMALNRRIHLANNRIREGNFSLKGLLGFDMNGRFAGIIGTGRIGACTVKILHGFGCKILAHDVFQNQTLIDNYDVRYVTLEELYANSDVISLHAPLMKETYHLINAKAIKQMKKGVMLINTARGGLVDTIALLDGLRSGFIGYAGLDVYEEEAAYFFEDRSDSIITDDVLARLTTFNNVMITSHQGSFTDVAQTNIVECTLENIREFELGKRGGELANAVVLPK